VSSLLNEASLRTHAAELVDRERQLAERQIWDLATTQKSLEDLQASRAGKAWRVWDFLGQTEAALVPLSFSPLHSGLPAQQIGVMLPLLDSTRGKMS
jgi:hypothetical protein